MFFLLLAATISLSYLINRESEVQIYEELRCQGTSLFWPQVAGANRGGQRKQTMASDLRLRIA